MGEIVDREQLLEYTVDSLAMRGVQQDDMNKRFYDMNADLDMKLQFIVDFMDSRGWLSDHTFTFPDGDTYWATGYEPRPEGQGRPIPIRRG